MEFDQQYTVKFCKQCGQTKPATTEYFRISKKNGALWSPCKQCVADRIRKRKQDPEVRQKKKEYDRQWRLVNKDRRNAEFRKKYLTDPIYRAKRKATHLRYRQQVANQAKRRCYERSDPKAIYGHYKKGAKIRSIPFQLSFEEFMTFWQQPCFYCGLEIKTIGIDRVENKQGYFMENLVSCCARCNRAKSDMSKAEWIEFIRRLNLRFEVIKNLLLAST